jgi:surface carbohydrate biosynthesis protein (TIGR04326 family)
MSSELELLISDLETKTEDTSCDVLHWSIYLNSESVSVFSLPVIVEENAERFKNQYLSLIYDLGNKKVNGQRIIDKLVIRKNFSFWWMTLFVEKNNYAKSPQIDDIIKLMALEHFFKTKKYKKLKLISSNKDLSTSISLLAKKLEVDFECHINRTSKSDLKNIKNLFQMLPNIIKSPIWLIHYLYSNWALKGIGVEEWRNTNATSTFVSYLFNLVPLAVKEGRFESRYWTSLTDLLDDNLYPSNWLHIYVKDNVLPSAKKARAFIQKLNTKKPSYQVHVTLASFLSIQVVSSTLRDCYKVFRLNSLVKSHIKLTSGYLWPLFYKDCKDSMTGIPATSNLLFFNLFEKAMYELPRQKRGCYLQENISWELGFISAWQSAGHQKNLIGFPHAAVNYWDLRYFLDQRSYKNKSPNNIPLPNFVGVNGDISKQMYLSGGYPKLDLIEVESLRFLYLSNFLASQNKKELKRTKEKVVLVAGDYLRKNTNKQFNLLSTAMSDIDQSFRFIIKPHPACPIDMKDFPSIRGELSYKPIQELMKISDIVYTSLVTATAVEAYCADLPVISFLDGKTLNVSPLRNFKGVYFVTNPKSLAKAINTLNKNGSDQDKNYFYLDSSLPRWRKWLNIDSNKVKKIVKENASF